MNILTLKSQVGLSSALVISFLASNSFASEFEHVTFDPSISLPPAQKLRRSKDYYWHMAHPTPESTQRKIEHANIVDLFGHVGKHSTFEPGRLYSINNEAIRRLMPEGIPWNFLTSEGSFWNLFFDLRVDSVEQTIPVEEIKIKNIDTWKNYNLEECSGQLALVGKSFKKLADWPQFSNHPYIRTSYTVLSNIASSFLGVFNTLQNDSPSSAKKYFKRLNKWFKNNPEISWARAAFFAVEKKLRFELNNS